MVVALLAVIVICHASGVSKRPNSSGNDRRHCRRTGAAAGRPRRSGRADGWAAPLTDDDLAGESCSTTLTFGCINCQHTLPHLKAWQQRYAADGLVILSIHSPEFAYEADPANVAEFIASEGIEYPVALDPDRAVWRAWDNRYWPAFYLYDELGRLRVQHFGEGAYDSTDDALRVLLGVVPDRPRAVVP